MQVPQQEQLVGVWQYIPRNAFLYFPQGQQIKIGSGQKQWRKIFEGNQVFDAFQLDALNKLEQKLVLSNIKTHQWFDTANKLRYLQANKWKKTPTCQAIAQYSRYRNSQFPIKQTHQILYMLNKGTFYLCGRDQQYRPIIVADLEKFDSKDVDLIPPTLVFLMQFVINNLLIEGQVQNYVLIMNLQAFKFSQKSLVSKIVSFTSNSYRGRLFVSYLLGAPSLLRVGWNSFASSFVSENTLKKLKVTGDLYHSDMWSHIDKQVIQKKYGGSAENIVSSYWPPCQQKLLYESKSTKNQLISIEDYNSKFSNMELQKRKVLKSLLRRKTIVIRQQHKSTIFQQKEDPELKSLRILKSIDRQSLSDATILIQSSIFPEDLKFIRTFFQTQAYQKIK